MEEEDRPNGPEPTWTHSDETHIISDERWNEFVQSFLEEALEKGPAPFSILASWDEVGNSDPIEDLKVWQQQVRRLSGTTLWNISFGFQAPFPYIEALYYGTSEVPLDPGRIEAARYLACGSRVRNVLGRQLLPRSRR